MAAAAAGTAKPTRSTVVVPSLYQLGGEQTEIVTHITIPPEGGWGWVVVACSFLCIFVVDGIVFTFGSLFADIRKDLDEKESLVALINSTTFALYFMAGPLASAVINKYGFRECAMAGSIMCSSSLLMTYFMKTYGTVFLFYGVCTGIGTCFVNLPAGLIVGFYFERLRALTMSMVLVGSSFGCMLMYPINSKLVHIAGWRIVTLIHSAMAGTIFFLGMSFKPLSPVLVTQTTDEPTVVLTNLPNVSNEKIKTGGVQKLFNTVSNVNFPTTADMVKQGVLTEPVNKPGTSDKKMPKYTLSTTGPDINERQLKKMQSVISQPADGKTPVMEVTLAVKTPKKKQSFWSRLCHWQKQAPQARPMYRDDVFYNGRVNDLEVYKKSVIDVQDKDRFAIEYHMAVTRATAVDDITEKNIICSIAVRRVLASMIDPSLMKLASFLLICLSSFCTYLGVLVPYIFLESRNLLEGIDKSHCSSMISVIGFTNVVGRLIIGGLACKISPILLYVIAASITGISTMAFNFSFNLYYQYTIAGVCGFFNACLFSLRSMAIVELYGIENLTNATGLMYIFAGLGSLMGTPASMIIKTNFGFSASFYTAGAFLLTAALFMVPLKTVRHREVTSSKKTKRPKKKPDQKTAHIQKDAKMTNSSRNN